MDITDRKLAEERQVLLARELQHRTKNLMQVIQSVADRSLSGDRPLGLAREAFVARLRALASAQELLTSTEWHGAPLEQVIAHELQPFAARVSMEGPFVVLSPNATQGFALVIHELATNAIKHGALSTPGGKVAIRWSIEENSGRPTLTFRWQERGGPDTERTTSPSRLRHHAPRTCNRRHRQRAYRPCARRLELHSRGSSFSDRRPALVAATSRALDGATRPPRDRLLGRTGALRD